MQAGNLNVFLLNGPPLELRFFLRYRLETPMDPMFPPALEVCSRRMLCKNS